MAKKAKDPYSFNFGALAKPKKAAARKKTGTGKKGGGRKGKPAGGGSL